jgi:hypothetical protein
MVVPIIQVMDDHFTIEKHDNLGIHHWSRNGDVSPRFLGSSS